MVMIRMFPPPPPPMERKNHLYKEDVGVDPVESEGGGTVVMMRMFPTIERKNHLCREDVGVYAAEDEGGGDGGDDEDVPPHGEEESPV